MEVGIYYNRRNKPFLIAKMDLKKKLFSISTGFIENEKDQTSRRRRRRKTMFKNFLEYDHSFVNLIDKAFLLYSPTQYSVQYYRVYTVLETPTRIWTKQRSTDFWNTVMVGFDEVQWLSNFRMPKELFLEICDQVRDDLSPKTTQLQPRKPISDEMQVGIAIYKLASCAEMRVIGNNFGVPKYIIFQYF